MYYKKELKRSVEGVFEGIKESGFLEENSITDYDLVCTIIRDEITPKVINNSDQNIVFSDDEFESLLKKIMLYSVMEKLKKTGIIKSFEDNDTRSYFINKNV